MSLPQIGAHARFAHSADLGSLRKAMPNLLMAVTLPSGQIINSLTEPEYRMKEESHLCYKSLCTARYLIPIDRRAEFDAEPERYAVRPRAVWC